MVIQEQPHKCIPAEAGIQKQTSIEFRMVKRLHKRELHPFYWRLVHALKKDYI